MAANDVTSFTDIIYRGTVRRYVMNCVASDGVTPRNVSGWTAVMTWRRTEKSPDPAALEISGSVTGDGSTGQLVFVVSRTDSLSLTSGKYAVSVFRTNAGSEDELGLGEITCKNSVHDPVS